jgi:hypothetical protein
MPGFVKWLLNKLKPADPPPPCSGCSGGTVTVTVVPIRRWPTSAAVWSRVLGEWMPIAGGPVDLPPGGDIFLLWR